MGAAKNARTLALATDTAFGVGLIGVAFAAYFAITATKPTVTIATPVWVAVEHDQLTLRGRF